MFTKVNNTGVSRYHTVVHPKTSTLIFKSDISVVMKDSHTSKLKLIKLLGKTVEGELENGVWLL